MLKTSKMSKNCVWNPATCNFENWKYLASIMDHAAIICDEVINADAKLSPRDDDETKTIPTNFNENKAICKTQNFYILLSVFLITIALLTAVSIYCYLIKHQRKQKHLLSFHFTSNKIKI